MDKLKKANLYRNDLIPVSGKLVERYNKCLLKMGFTETKLSEFSIDGMGWSPEIAVEKDNSFYLNNGEANTHAIIITPKQRNVAIYNPFHSFDAELMQLIFKKHFATIKNITRDAAVCVDFDQKIDVFYEPLDVLKYKDVTIKFHLINNLKKAKKEQLLLIETFNRDTNFIDEGLHKKLLESAKKYGDLRERVLDLEKINYTASSFYTEAFGGVFVLRDFIETILIFEDELTYKEAIKDTTHDVLMYLISHKELIKKLKSHFIIELDVEEENTKKRHDRIKKFLFSGFLQKTTHSVKDILQDPILFKSYLNKIDIKARKKVMSLELFLEKKQKNKSLKIDEQLDYEVYVGLHKPHSSLKPSHQDLIWQLLVTIAPKDVLFLYWYDKEQFYELYKNVNESTQEWIIETILNAF